MPSGTRPSAVQQSFPPPQRLRYLGGFSSNLPKGGPPPLPPRGAARGQDHVVGPLRPFGFPPSRPPAYRRQGISRVVQRPSRLPVSPGLASLEVFVVRMPAGWVGLGHAPCGTSPSVWPSWNSISWSLWTSPRGDTSNLAFPVRRGRSRSRVLLRALCSRSPHPPTQPLRPQGSPSC